MITTISLSLPTEQLELLETVRYQNEQLLAMQNKAAYLTEPEACERLKVSLTTIRKWRKEGWLRFFAEGDNIRYRVDFLDEDYEKRALVVAPLSSGQSRQPALRKQSPIIRSTKS